MNHKRGKPRDQVRCTLCTDGRWNIGGDRRLRNEVPPEAPRVSNGQFWDWCPDCEGTGKQNGETCVLCGGTKVVDFIVQKNRNNTGGWQEFSSFPGSVRV